MMIILKQFVLDFKRIYQFYSLLSKKYIDYIKKENANKAKMIEKNITYNKYINWQNNDRDMIEQIWTRMKNNRRRNK